MPRRCSICDHPERTAIETALSTASFRAVAGQFGVSNAAVQRHASGHLRRAVARVAQERADLSAAALLDRLQGLLETAEAGVASAVKANDRRALAALIREARETLVRLGQVAAGLWTEQRGGTVNVERMQVLAVGELTVDELRKLAALAPAPEDQR